MVKLLRGLALLGIVLGSWVARAQEPPEQDLTKLTLEELAQAKVYSASRHAEDLRMAPSSVTIITANEIAQYGWRTLADALGSVRGFYTSYDRNYTYLGVRGFLRPGDYNDRILLLINGHRLNDNVYGSAFLGTEFPLDIDLIDRIEVVRGPSSSLYGTNAIFGVVNVITRKQGSAPTAEASGEASSFLGRTGRITLGGERKGASALVSGSLYRSNGQSSLYFPEFRDPATNNGYARNVDGDSFAHAFGDFSAGDFRLQVLWGSREKIIPTASFGANFNDPGNRTTDTRGYADLSFHRKLSSRTELEARAYYDLYQYQGTYAYGGADPAARFLTQDKSRADWVGGDAMLAWQLGKHRVTAGTQYEHSLRVDQWEYQSGVAQYLNDHRTPSQAAVYSQVELKLGRKLAVNAGGRVDWFDTFGATPSPRVAVIYTPAPATVLKYIFGRSFRAPNAYESYYSDGVSNVGNPNLQPESMLSHEVVIEHGVRPWLQVTGAGFYSRIRQLIDQVQDPASGLTRFINQGRDTSKGVEFEATAKRKSGLALGSGYTLADTRDSTTGDRLNNSPLHLAKLHAAVPVLRHGSAGLELLYASAQSSYSDTRIPSSLLANITFLSKPLWNGWTFSASCYNLLNRRWLTPVGPAFQQAAIIQDGRTYRFKLTYRLPDRGRGKKR